MFGSFTWSTRRELGLYAFSEVAWSDTSLSKIFLKFYDLSFKKVEGRFLFSFKVFLVSKTRNTRL